MFAQAFPHRLRGLRGHDMDVQQELQSLVASGLRFSIEMNGCAVLVWVGDYLRQRGAAATLSSFDQAIEWLRRHGQMPVAREA
jgi:hypothetical protein